MNLKNKLLSMYLIIMARGYFIYTDKGVAYNLPNDRPALEYVQDKLEVLDRQLEEMITELILEERDDV